MERQLHEVLRAQVCPHARRRGVARRDRRGDGASGQFRREARPQRDPAPAARRCADGAVKPSNNDEPPPQAPVTRAMQVTVPSPSGELKSFLQAFGQANRGTPARPPQPSPLQPIMLMRSPVVNDRVLAANDSRVQRLLDTTRTTARWSTSCSSARLPASRCRKRSARRFRARQEPHGRRPERAMGAAQPGGVSLQLLSRGGHDAQA